MKSIKIFILCLLLLGAAIVLAVFFEQTQAALWVAILGLIFAAANIGTSGVRNNPTN
ncbi:hypothetical protein [Shewanella vaxholmensis]|uniref:Uncharacterized protein n=1 Tax=Shewanella vaxholmensis TaxID=3063535 RepID=A0ABU9UWN4_9GAMM